MTYKDEAREFLSRAGVDPDIWDWDIAGIMADFAHVKVGEATSPTEQEIVIGSDLRWQFHASTQYEGLQELVAYDPAGNFYYPVTTPCGRICLRQRSSAGPKEVAEHMAMRNRGEV